MAFCCSLRAPALPIVLLKPSKTLLSGSVGCISVPCLRKPGGLAVSASASEDSRPTIDDYPEGIISGEWTENFSLLSYDDLRTYLESQIVNNDKMKPSAVLGDVMSSPVWVAKPDQKIAEIDHHYQVVSGLPVVDSEGRCVGVISTKDKAKAANGPESKVGEVMSSPAITLSPEETVLDAAALMLKKKVHRIPIVDEHQKVIGIVTRTDVFLALEATKV